MLRNTTHRKLAVSKDCIVALLIDETGTTAIEYGLVVSLVSIAVVAATTELGDVLQQLFGHIADKIDHAMR